jgi:hypothetical protein
MSWRIALRDRFLGRYRVDESGCWIWTGSTASGYGSIKGFDPRVGRSRTLRATVVSWYVHKGEWPPLGLDMCHRCDNPPCVNPDHLFPGTALDNIRDAVRKGRFASRKRAPVGAESHKAKLTSEQAGEIRRLYFDTSALLSDLAQQFGVSRTTIREVVTNRRYHDPAVSTITGPAKIGRGGRYTA